MEYLNQVLGIRVVYKDDTSISMPNYIHARYRLQRVTLDGKTAIFVYPKDELEWFRGYEDQYAIIGGTACDLLMTDGGLDFRATKDIDLVLIVEAVDLQFANRFWEYMIAGGYEHRNKSTGDPQFYRFTNPRSRDYPMMIELFTRKPAAVSLPEDAVLTPLPVDEEISSLSAILLNDDYYEFLKQGRVRISEVTILDAPYMIPFKAKAWLDLSDRKAAGEAVDSKNIRKHKNDVFRLTELLDQNQERLHNIPVVVRNDMRLFLERIGGEDVDLKQLGIRGKSKESILNQLMRVYG